jgi:hypothetical protein
MNCKDFDYDCTKTCVDAWSLSREYNCYESPDPIENFDNVEIGDLLEFNQGGERIWGRVIEKCFCDVIVEVVSDLLLSHPFNKGDKILLGIINVYNWKRQ